MRRRIKIDPDSGRIEDHTDMPDRDHNSASYFDEVGTALYDEEVWARYKDAQKALNAAAGAVLAKVIDEPLDEIELQIAEEQEKLFRMFDLLPGELNIRAKALKARLIENAKTKAKPTT